MQTAQLHEARPNHVRGNSRESLPYAGGDFTLLVVSHVIHYEHDGRLWAYGPYAREIDIWADLFHSIVIASPLRREAPPRDCVAFSRRNISMAPQLETGGDRALDKLWQILALPLHVWNLCHAMAKADAIHVRCPGNLGLLGAALAPMFSSRIVAKYAGQWACVERTPASFRIQRWLLSSRWWRKGIVTVYGEWPNQSQQVVPFFTSMMTAEQVRRSALAAARKSLCAPVRVLYSGRLAPQKGLDTLLHSARLLKDQGAAFHLAIVGDGPERSGLEALAVQLGVESQVHFAGAVPYDDVMNFYESAHILVLASHSEGWPKVITEAMCHGVVCVATNVGLLPWMLDGRGLTFPTGDDNALAKAIIELASDPTKYRKLSRESAAWAGRFSSDGLRDSLWKLLSKTWNL